MTGNSLSCIPGAIRQGRSLTYNLTGKRNGFGKISVAERLLGQSGQNEGMLAVALEASGRAEESAREMEIAHNLQEPGNP